VRVSVEQKGGQRCSYCRDHKLKGALVGCERCATIVHQECWDTNKGCPTPGCLRAIGDRGWHHLPDPDAPQQVGFWLRQAPRLRAWWEAVLNRYPKYASLDWSFMTGMIIVMGVIFAIVPLVMMMLLTIHRTSQHGGNTSVAAHMALCGGVVAYIGWMLRRKA
jgi:hypothetical protein